MNEQEMFEFVQKVDSKMEHIKKEHQGTEWTGVETCPLCGNKLHVHHDKRTGHVMMSCEIKDCLYVIE